MAEIQFYTNPMSRGQIARWALEEVGVDYEQVLLDYDTTMKGDEYLSINPMGKVPAIQHGDQVVTETAAICAYLAHAFPAANLGPRDAEAAPYFRWLFFAAGPLEQAVINRNLGVTADAERQRMVGYGTYDRTVSVLADALAEDDYVCGSRFTMADVYLGAHVGWGLQFETLPKNPTFEAYAARVSQRDAFRRAKQIDEALIADQADAADS